MMILLGDFDFRRYLWHGSRVLGFPADWTDHTDLEESLFISSLLFDEVMLTIIVITSMAKMVMGQVS